MKATSLPELPKQVRDLTRKQTKDLEGNSEERNSEDEGNSEGNSEDEGNSEALRN